MLSNFIDTSGLEPHGLCLSWRPDVFWSLVGADLVIAAAYLLISSALMVFIWKRKDISLRGIGVMFSAFILLCAASHISDVVTMWLPEYGSQIALKFATAAVSLATAVVLWTMLPAGLRMPTAKQMNDVQQSLKFAQNGMNSDTLTGIWSRIKILDIASIEMERFNRYAHPVSLIFIDLDFFKNINDSFGHSVGDDVLRKFSEITAQCMRSTDSFGRWGGEEFLIVTANSSLDTAVALAERIRIAIQKFEFPVIGHITASFGVAMYKHQESWDLWVSRADKALYKAKKAGRNQVCAE